MNVKHLLIILIIVAAAGVAALNNTIDSGLVDDAPRHLIDIKGGSRGGSLKEPSYAVTDKKGRIFIADSGNRRVAVFNRKGRFLFEFGGLQSTKPLVYPHGIGITNDNRVVVADTGAGIIYEFTSSGEYVRIWLDDQAQIKPANVFVARDGTVYVTDLAGGQVLHFTDNGKLMKTIRPRQVSLNAPQGLAVNADGTVWVADGGNYNVKLLSPDGQLKTIFDGGPARALTMAKGLAVDKKNRIYVADTISNEVRVFDYLGNDILSFGPAGENKSSFRLPIGLSIDAQGKIYVADQANNKVQVWGW